jgi:hypothetical protein
MATSATSDANATMNISERLMIGILRAFVGQDPSNPMPDKSFPVFRPDDSSILDGKASQVSPNRP